MRQYINSIAPKVNLFADAVRGHGGIESLHWILDVVFNEDASRLRNGESTQNFGFLRKFVVSLLKRDTSKGSLKGKRKKAAWSTDLLETLLFGEGLRCDRRALQAGLMVSYGQRFACSLFTPIASNTVVVRHVPKTVL